MLIFSYIINIKHIINYSCCFRFTPEELGPFTAMRNSAQKQLRTEAVRQFPFIEAYADSILPKKQQVFCSKWCVHIRSFIFVRIKII